MCEKRVVTRDYYQIRGITGTRGQQQKEYGIDGPVPGAVSGHGTECGKRIVAQRGLLYEAGHQQARAVTRGM